MNINSSNYSDPLEVYNKYVETHHHHAESIAAASRKVILNKLNEFPDPTEYSDEFLGVYVHGGHKEFKFEECEAAFASFRKCSKNYYPLYFFYADWGDRMIDEGFKEIVVRHSPLKVIEINPLESIEAYSSFMIWDLWKHIPEQYNKVLTFQDDGHLYNSGWEEFINEHDPDYIGSYNIFDPEHYETTLPIKNLKSYTNKSIDYIINGGFSFRKRDKMVEISKAFSKNDIDYERLAELRKEEKETDTFAQDAWGGKRFNEDQAITYIGFGKDILKPISKNLADQFSSTSFEQNSKAYGFHSFDAYYQ